MDAEQSNEGCTTPEASAPCSTGNVAQQPPNRSSTKKHRASIACNYCRFRKVRCNVGSSKPCYNCTADNVECVVPRQRPRGKPKGYGRLVATPHDSSSRHNPSRLTEPANSWLESWLAPEDVAREVDTVDKSPQPPLAMQPTTGDDDNDSPLRPWEAHETVAPDRHFDWYGAAAQSLTSPISTSDTVARSNSHIADVDMPAARLVASDNQDLPPYVQPAPSDFPLEDLSFLRQKGALTLPDPELHADLLKNYFDLVHHCLPLIDLDAFQASITNPDRHGRVSLLLLQAIMFSATAWADVKLVRRAGFLTRDAMRRSYYNKTKLLYDFNYERDRIAIVQSLTLLTTWWVTPTEQKDGYYWCSVALAVAKSIGLHRDAHGEGLPSSVRRLRRRIWWCCLIRDAITSLGTNRAPRVQPNDFTVAPLTLEDLRGSEEPPDVNRRRLASICIALTKLCGILSNIVDLFYAENPIGHIGILYPKQDNNPEAASTPAPPVNGLEKLEMCEQDLQRWREQVPDDLLHQSPVPTVTSSVEEAVVLQRALLAMLHLVAQFCLHRPRALAERAAGLREDQTRASQKSMRAAAESLNKIVMDLYRVDLVRRLPGTSISCILTVSWSHVFDLQSPNFEVRQEGARRFEECKLALRELVDTNVAAEWAIAFLTFAASHVSRLFKRRHVVQPPTTSDTGSQGWGKSVPNMTHNFAPPTIVDPNLTGVQNLHARDGAGTNPCDKERSQPASSGLGFPSYDEDMAIGSTFKLSDDDWFNLDFSTLTDMWVGMPPA